MNEPGNLIRYNSMGIKQLQEERKKRVNDNRENEMKNECGG